MRDCADTACWGNWADFQPDPSIQPYSLSAAGNQKQLMFKAQHSPRRQVLILAIFTGLLLPVLGAESSSAGEATSWGGLRGRITISESPEPPVTLEITRDEEVCGNLGLTDESLMVNADNRGVRHVAIWLDSRTPVPIHPELTGKTGKPVIVDNKGCRFEPRMSAVQVGQPVHFSNSDSIAHNVAVFARRNQPFSEIVPASQPLEKTFPKSELLPIRIDCSIHAWMKSWLIITEHPYVAITDENGQFEIRNIPAGEWKFRFWHERPGNIRQLVRDGSEVTLEKGALTLSINSELSTDLGDLVVSASQFATKKK
jgi:plastocyanin